jgi:hypothetical protein
MQPACRMILGLGVACLCITACGPADAPRASVSGKISYKGTPLPTGSIAFVNGSTVASAKIENGQYTVDRAAIGDNKISVTTPSAAAAQQMQKQSQQKVEGKEFSSAAPPAVVAIPGSYSNADASGLSYKVTAEPKQTHDIDLK